jgi:hypothetical protein
MTSCNTHIQTQQSSKGDTCMRELEQRPQKAHTGAVKGDESSLRHNEYSRSRASLSLRQWANLPFFHRFILTPCLFNVQSPDPLLLPRGKTFKFVRKDFEWCWHNNPLPFPFLPLSRLSLPRVCVSICFTPRRMPRVCRWPKTMRFLT